MDRCGQINQVLAAFGKNGHLVPKMKLIHVGLSESGTNC